MRVSNYAIAAGASAFLTASPALADVTPEQVWESFSGYLQSFGYTVDATETRSGDSLELADLVFTMELPDDEGRVAVGFGEMTLEDQGDGTVRVILPADTQISVDAAAEDEGELGMVIDYGTEALDMVVSGDPDAMLYAFSAQAMTAVLSELVVDGETVPRDELRAELTASELEGETQVVLADGMRRIDQTVSIGSVSYDGGGQDPEGDGAGSFTGSLSSLVSESQAEIPLDMRFTDMAALLEAGMSMTGRITYGAGQSQFSFTEDGSVTNGSSASESGSFDLAMSEDMLRYGIAAEGIAYNVEGGEIPFPLSAEMDELALTIEAPISASEEPQDMALAMTLGGLTLSDMIWNIFDSGNVLPRDPATVAFDITGQVTPFVDFLDPAQMEALEDGERKPGELNALTLNNLTVEAAGAQLTGSGDFTFDNSDLESFDGMPKPTGAVDLRLAGANGLIDNLIAMGLISDQDAMGARMMMNMFGVPASDPDTLTSKIEINEQGQILANGQRIK
ncbi:DUF2125 domain-containing protein [Salipiger abyssi]|nr:DUF2125 domain-containing protein [Salipiger abyssi]